MLARDIFFILIGCRAYSMSFTYKVLPRVKRLSNLIKQSKALSDLILQRTNAGWVKVTRQTHKKACWLMHDYRLDNCMTLA